MRVSIGFEALSEKQNEKHNRSSCDVTDAIVCDCKNLPSLRSSVIIGTQLYARLTRLLFTVFHVVGYWSRVSSCRCKGLNI